MMYQSLVSTRVIKIFLSILFACLLLPGISTAKDFRNLYPLKQLRHVQVVYGKNIRGILFGDIRHYLLPGERRTLSTVTLNIPLYGGKGGLFDYHMNLQTGKMTIPALSVKFFDDLAIAFAWYERKGKDRTEIVKYVSRLYSQQAYMQRPLEALGVPKKAWKLDAYVDDVSQKILKSGITFLLLHELGHWHYRHAPYDAISSRQAQAQETQSDFLALEVMGRMHTIPYGIVPWFMVTGLLQGGNPTTHPLSADRLYAIAGKIEDNPALFISQENRKTLNTQEVISIATGIRTIADEIHRAKSN